MIAGMPGQSFTKTGQAVLNAAGYATVTLTCPSGYVWDVVTTSMSTSQTDTTVVPPQFTLYRGDAPSTNAFLEGSFSGNRDTSDTAHRLLGGESLTGEWVAGTPGKTATLRLTGTQTPT